MQKVKLVLMHTTCDEGTVKVWLQGLESKQSFKDRCLSISRDRTSRIARKVTAGHKYIIHISMTARDSKPTTDHRESMYSF